MPSAAGCYIYTYIFIYLYIFRFTSYSPEHEVRQF